MEAESTETLRNDETSQEYRVQVSTKKAVVEQMNKYKEVLKMVMEGQAAVPEETKRLLLQELLTNFEAAVQDNVLVNGQTWDEAPEDEEDEAIALETLLDDTIVETSRRRRRFPKEILPHVVRSLKAERKLMGLYEQAVKPEQVTRDPEQESIMSSLSAAAPGMVKQAIQVIKSSDDEDRRLKKREKNRVAAQRSRKRQTQRADLLHETFEYLQRRNSQLRREVDSLSEERRRLSEALRTHEPFCPIMHCSSASPVPLNNAISCLQPASVQ